MDSLWTARAGGLADDVVWVGTAGRLLLPSPGAAALVSGRPDQRVRAPPPYLYGDPRATKGPVERNWVLPALLAMGGGPRPGSRCSARSNARTNDLDAGEGCRRIQPARAGPLGQRIVTTSGQAVGSGAMPACARGRPALSWSADPGSGDVLLDGVIPHAVGAAARSSRAGQPGAGRQGVCGSWPQRISGVGSTRTSRITSGHPPKRWRVRGWRERLLAERAKGVVAAAGQLASDRQGGAVAAQALLDRRVVGVVWRGRAGGALGRLKQRPAQHRWALAGKTAGGALAVGGVDGDVQAGVAHREPVRRESAHLAKLGPDRHRGQRADAVQPVQRAAARLAAGDADQLAPEQVEFGIQVVE